MICFEKTQETFQKYGHPKARASITESNKLSTAPLLGSSRLKCHNFKIKRLNMKSILRLLLISALLASANIMVGQRAPPALTPAQQTIANNRAVTVAALVTQIRLARSDQAKQELIQAAINNDPEIAPALTAELITTFPIESATLTGFVVQSIIQNTSLTVAVQNTILTTVARSAVDAAIRIPATSVPNLIETVNSVKLQLANVPPAAQAAVSDFTVPIQELPTIPADPTPTVIPTTGDEGTVLDTNLDTQIIVSNDNP